MPEVTSDHFPLIWFFRIIQDNMDSSISCKFSQYFELAFNGSLCFVGDFMYFVIDSLEHPDEQHRRHQMG